MSCARGEASPNQQTKLKLFADSGGYCQNPNCNKQLFSQIGSKEIHIAEMAHIISAGRKGPRSKSELTKAEKGNFENLILLCPNCHTTIDKAENEFPDYLIKKWKNDHSQKINALFNIKRFANREEARQAIEQLLNENNSIFRTYGPLTDYRYNPEAETPTNWVRRIHSHILPNNRKIYKILEANYALMNQEEKVTTEIFKQHVLDFEAVHINGEELNAIRFPRKLTLIFKE